MSQVLKDFVDALNHPRGHLRDLEALGVTTDGHTPGVGWEELPSSTFPGGPDGERVFATNLSRLGIGWDEKARVLYFGVEFSKENLVAEPGKAARTKTVLEDGRRYKGSIILNPGPTFQSLEVRNDNPNTPLVRLMEAFDGKAEVYLVGPFNGWALITPFRKRYSGDEWKAILDIHQNVEYSQHWGRFSDNLEKYKKIDCIDYQNKILYFSPVFKNRPLFKSSVSARDFLYRLQYIINQPVLNLQTDNGSEFAGAFEQAVGKIKANHYFSRAYTPKDNPEVERFNQTLEYEWLKDGRFTSDCDKFNQRLTEWLIEYNFQRPHQALDYLTPMEYIEREQQRQQPPASFLLPMCPDRTPS